MHVLPATYTRLSEVEGLRLLSGGGNVEWHVK